MIDIDSLLDIVANVEPFGMNMWAEVEEKFNEWAMEAERPTRDADSLKSKFDKLTNVNKPT